MIRSQKAPGRYVHNQPLGENNPASANAGDITSYIGKILAINYHQVVVEDILGQGGFAFVFLVRAPNQQRYALKRMYVNNQRDLHVCQREIALIKEFATHPNIVKYVDSSTQRTVSGTLPRRPYYPGGDASGVDNEDDAIYEILLLTEYCSNGALITRFNEQRTIGLPLNERQILRTFADVCHAVSACHFRRPQPILHRDIKLENILINSQQSHVLCDFGSAILLPPSPTNDFQQYPVNQLTTTIIQQLEEEIQRYTTLSYRAPEMVDLYSRTPITLKADIWAMGCLLYKLMYNTMPFGDSILAIQNGTFVIPDDMTQTYSRELNLLVRYILEIDINKRPDIWQVSYVTYKLLGSECPISNRCQSKVPDLKTVSMPLTDSESRIQRTNALSKSKSTSSNLVDESSSLGTAVNPRERPRGMMAPSTSLINFNQASQQPPSTLAVPPPPASNTSRAGSATQLMFDDDFSKIPSHAISLTNIPTVTSNPANDQTVSRVRPSPPATVSTASGFALHQQFFLPPPPPPSTSSSNAQTHRRSSSQTISPTNVQSAFPSASSADISPRDEASSDDNDADQSGVNSHSVKVRNHSDFYVDDDQMFSPDNRNIKPKPLYHRPSTEEAEKSTFFSSQNQRTSGQSSYEHASIRQDYSRHDSINNGFDQLINDDSDSEPNQRTRTSPHSTILPNEHNYPAEANNPFLHAPFHRSSANKQASSSLSNEVTPAVFDPESIMIGKKTSAFSLYQKQASHPDNLGTDMTSISGISMAKGLQSGSSIPDKASPSTNVFTSAPFKTKSKSKQRSTTTDSLNSTTSNLNVDNHKTNLPADSSPERQGYSNLSFNTATIDDYYF